MSKAAFPLQAGLYFITDRHLSKNGVLHDAEQALKAGVKVIQYREKEHSTGSQLHEALQIKELCSRYNALFIVNDRIDIALASCADGVHLGQEDMPLVTAKRLLPEAIIGVTVHNTTEAEEAEKGGASYLGVSPVFETSTKKDAGKPAGIRLIKDVRKATTLSLVAIGGINDSNLDSVLSAGCRSVCMISAVLQEKDVEGRCRALNSRILGY
jgi:thiamine-phosphate pyrophosphorylase